MKIVLVIPARFESTRLPGKPLIDILGKTMLKRVYEQCIKVMPKELVYIATEDDRIKSYCEANNMNVKMTSRNCLTGTDRVAEFSKLVDADYYINVQGDEPLISPNDITLIKDSIKTNRGKILNGYCAITEEEEYRSFGMPKVVFRKDKRLLYMSRSAIPGNKKDQFKMSFRQVCVYAFTKESLNDFYNYGKKTPFEKEEDIETLRFLELGYDIQMIKLSNSSVPVDYPEDVIKVEKLINNGK